jgi:opacity protein-like surface antigen
MKRLAIASSLLLVILSPAALAQAKTEASEMPYSGAPCTASGGIAASAPQVASFTAFDKALRSALKRQDVDALAFLVRFPLSVNSGKGTILIPDAFSLGGHFADIFPAKLRDLVGATLPEDFICRYDEGLGYRQGVIWVSTVGPKFAVDTVNLPDAAQTLPTPTLEYTCETKTHRIVVDELEGGKYRYRSWDKPKDLTESPNVDLKTGELSVDGTGVCSVPVYSFKKGDVVYSVNAGLGCSDGSEPAKATGQLIVNIAGKDAAPAWCF